MIKDFSKLLEENLKEGVQQERLGLHEFKINLLGTGISVTRSETTREFLELFQNSARSEATKRNWLKVKLNTRKNRIIMLQNIATS